MEKWTVAQYKNMVIAYVNHKYRIFKGKAFTIDEMADFYLNAYPEEFTTSDVSRFKKCAEKILYKLMEYDVVFMQNGVYVSKWKVDKVFAASIDVYDLIEQERKEELASADTQKQYFVDYISAEEFSKFDFSKFGALLKQHRLLPPSYDRHPEVTIDVCNNAPRVELVFRSTTSPSYKTIKIHQNNIYTFSNGSNESHEHDVIYNKKLELWQNFMKSSLASIRWSDKVSRRGVVNTLEKRVKRLNKGIETLKHLEDFEKEFVRKYVNSSFDGFMDEDVVCFDRKVRNKNGEILAREKVVPMSPKTLEMCVLKLDHDEKLWEAEYIDDFRYKCEQIKVNAGYESKSWDETIDRLSGYLTAYKNDFYRTRGENMEEIENE